MASTRASGQKVTTAVSIRDASRQTEAVQRTVFSSLPLGDQLDRLIPSLGPEIQDQDEIADQHDGREYGHGHQGILLGRGRRVRDDLLFSPAERGYPFLVDRLIFSEDAGFFRSDDLGVESGMLGQELTVDL